MTQIVKIIIKPLVVLSILFHCSFVKAQVTFNSLEAVLRYADEHATSIQTSEKQEDLLGLKVKESKTNLRPTISSYASYNDNISLQPVLIPSQIFDPTAPEGSFNEVEFGTKFNYSIGTSAQWDILNFQKLFAVKTANAEWEQGKRNTALQKMNTYNTLANTYYSILLTQEAIAIYEENLSVATTIHTSAEGKYDKGVIGEAELNLSEIKKLQAENTLSITKSNLDQLYVQLQSQLNCTDSIRIEDTMDVFILEDESITTVHPEILVKKAEIEKQEQFLKQTKALRYPSLSLTYQNTKTWASDDFFNFSNSNELPNQFFGATLTIPFRNSSNKQKIKQSKLELEIKQHELENTKLVKQKEDELLVLKRNQTTEQHSQNEKILELQKKNDTHAINKYEKDIISLNDRLEQYDDLLIAQDNYLQSLGAVTINKYQLFIRTLNYE
ncbi:TolC family protein [Seonamhaeicola sp.]|uniref:TolC family protein n=1 Tax=Seonamhaeicola sp. TaxID=1912245 RepID=UPI002611F263|nr:TolC family protein [Seonamhaeicola sp.]